MGQLVPFVFLPAMAVLLLPLCPGCLHHHYQQQQQQQQQQALQRQQVQQMRVHHCQALEA
jgi:hypothetical protein